MQGGAVSEDLAARHDASQRRHAVQGALRLEVAVSEEEGEHEGELVPGADGVLRDKRLCTSHTQMSVMHAVCSTSHHCPCGHPTARAEGSLPSSMLGCQARTTAGAGISGGLKPRIFIFFFKTQPIGGAGTLARMRKERGQARARAPRRAPSISHTCGEDLHPLLRGLHRLLRLDRNLHCHSDGSVCAVYFAVCCAGGRGACIITEPAALRHARMPRQVRRPRSVQSFRRAPRWLRCRWLCQLRSALAQW